MRHDHRRRGAASAISRWARNATALVAAGGLAAVAGAGDCEPQWDGTIGQPGMNTEVIALALFDDGGGPVLHAAGSFDTAGGQPVDSIARWDGSTWSALGAGVPSNGIMALTAFDDGAGPALYAGGAFTVAGGQAADRMARWDGAQWSALGEGLNNTVLALAAFDDGTGPALYAGGVFTAAGGAPAGRIARWDGRAWSALGAGVDDDVLALAVFDDGGGPALYAGGRFITAGGRTVNRIARWNGESWSPLGSGMNCCYVSALAAFDDGTGPALYAGGSFTMAGGQTASRIAKWNGAAWSSLDSGASAPVFALATFDDGGGPALYAGGYFAVAGGIEVNRIARWDGGQWSAVGSGVGGFVEALTALDGGTAPALYVGGQFTTAGGLPANRIAAWRGCPAEPPCAIADLDCDGVVSTPDLLLLLAAWGECADPECPADLDGDGSVNTADLLLLLANWTA